jgi:hypothetical protein
MSPASSWEVLRFKDNQQLCTTQNSCALCVGKERRGVWHEGLGNTKSGGLSRWAPCKIDKSLLIIPNVAKFNKIHVSKSLK